MILQVINMHRIIFLLGLALLCLSLAANAPYYPVTTIAENFTASWCQYCPDAYAGLSVLHNTFHSGELISVRYYAQSGNLSNPYSEDRFVYYNDFGLPSVVFNGALRISGGGADIADGSNYLQAFHPLQFGSSPVRMDVTQFNPQSGAMSVRVTMLSPTCTIAGDTIYFLLAEDNVTAQATRVTRVILTETINLSGQGSFQDFAVQFNISPVWLTANLWAASFIQLPDRSIIQSASTLETPEYNVRAAVPFSLELHGPMNSTYTSPTLHVFNTGRTDNYTIRLVRDTGPTDWYLNYCDEEGACYPGNVQFPFSLNSGENTAFHLNLIIGSSGISTFHFEVDSPNIEPFIIPFRFTTDDLPVNDETIEPLPLILCQNYPNPFNDETTLRLYAEKSLPPVVIDIFNSKGQKVGELKTGNLHKGLNTLTWQAVDKAGHRLPKGIYFSRLHQNNQTTFRKMLLIN